MYPETDWYSVYDPAEEYYYHFHFIDEETKAHRI